MRLCIVAPLLLALTACTPVIGLGSDPAGPSAKWATDTDAAWEELQRALVGKWKATTPDDRTFALAYRLVSNGTALVETFSSRSTAGR